MADINLNYYKTFLACGRFLNFTQAANYLYVSQPSVTRTIQQLEESLSCPLFIRSPQGLILTMEGQLLYNTLSDAFERIDAAEARLQTMREGVVRVGVNNLASEWIAQRTAQVMMNRYPNASVLLTSLDIQDMESAMLNNFIDIALCMTFTETPGQKAFEAKKDYFPNSAITVKLLGRFSDTFLVGPKYKDMANRVVSLEELSSLPFISPVSLSNAAMYYRNVLRGGTLREGDFPVNGAEHRLALAERNHGLAYFPEHFVRSKLKEEKLFKVVSTVETCPSFVFVAKNLSIPQSSLIKSFETLLSLPIF